MKLSLGVKEAGEIFSRESPDSSASVSTPVIAERAAVSGLTRYTCASSVPLRPLKFRLKVRRETAPVFGDWPIPMQGPQAFSITLAPEFIKSAKAPFSASLDKILLEPGEITRLTSGWTLLPLNMEATFIRSV